MHHGILIDDIVVTLQADAGIVLCKLHFRRIGVALEAAFFSKGLMLAVGWALSDGEPSGRISCIWIRHAIEEKAEQVVVFLDIAASPKERKKHHSRDNKDAISAFEALLGASRGSGC